VGRAAGLLITMDEPWLLLVTGLALGLLVAALAGLMLACRRLSRNLLEQGVEQSKHVERLNQDLAACQQGIIRMGEDLTALRDQFKRLEDKQQRMDQHDPLSMPYNQAARLVGLGASIEDLTQSCGLSKAEAELVVKLHSAKKP